MKKVIGSDKTPEKVAVREARQEENLPSEKQLILARWQGFEDDGSSGCYNYNFKV